MVWVRMQPRSVPVQMNLTSVAFLGALLLALLLGAFAGLGRDELLMICFGLSLGGLVIPRLLRRRAEKRVPKISDAQFIGQLGDSSDLPESLLIAQRNYVASVLGLKPDRLSAPMSPEDLSRDLDLLGSFSLAWNDLLDEIAEAHDATGLQEPQTPETVGDLVIQLARVKHRSGQ